MCRQRPRLLKGSKIDIDANTKIYKRVQTIANDCNGMCSCGHVCNNTLMSHMSPSKWDWFCLNHGDASQQTWLLDVNLSRPRQRRHRRTITFVPCANNLYWGMTIFTLYDAIFRVGNLTIDHDFSRKRTFSHVFINERFNCCRNAISCFFYVPSIMNIQQHWVSTGALKPIWLHGHYPNFTSHLELL